MRTFATYLYYIMATACCVLCPASLWAQEPQAEAPAEVPAATGTDTVPEFRISTYGQDTYEDLDVQLPMDAPSPENVKSVVDYDPVSGLYILRTYVGDTEITTPYAMTEQEYYDYSAKQAMNRYWREKNGTGEKSNEEKFSITDMKFDIGPADKIFGPGGVQIKTQGSAELLFGITHRNIDNPSISEKQRKNTTPDFDQKIQLNVNAKVGTRVNFNMNYNTESSFSFDQQAVKLGFKGEEDDIIQSLEAGNVSMQTSNSLITGGTSLFGIKTDLKFGKLKVSAIATQQQSEAKTVSSKGGTQTTEFEVSVDEYDENRHFFLGHFFRDNFDTWMSKLPNVASGVEITRLEVWVTNKRGDYDQARNIVAFMDLAEQQNLLNSTAWTPGTNTNPSNASNNLYSQVKAVAGVRDVQTTNQALETAFGGMGVSGGQDYEKVESARRLETSEYTYNKALGILSLRATLGSDEVLGVAYEYTYRGQTYQVGEFSSDESTKAPNVLIVKMLKGTSQSTDVPMWDLMLKNVYRISTSTLQQEDFELNIMYRNDSIGTDLRYITEGNIANQLLVRVMGLDRLDQRQRQSPDGIFDYVEGYTVISSTGTIMFPVLEPFGSHLRQKIGNDAIANKYVFEELYDMTLIEAQEYSDKNKFRLTGEYRGSSANEISLGAMNVPRGSVTVTAGGRTLVENTDYMVDYTMGTVTILDQSLIESNTPINVSLENQSMFNMQRKSLFGTHVEYEFSENFMLGGTIMHMSEKPITTKVNTGSEPVSNTIWGLNTAWRGESHGLTNLLDKLPFVNATQPSSFSVNAEFAQLIPGHSKDIGEAGYAYIDDFEATKQNVSLNYNPSYYWKLASTPSSFPESASDSIDYGKNRALIAWYSVAPELNTNRRRTPDHLQNDPDEQSKHITRNVSYKEIYPNKEIDTQTSDNLRVMNVSYFPLERGPYNIVADEIGTDGNLTNPTTRWGGIMRKIDSYSTDFESRNIEYIEFWMLDPFVNGVDPNHPGGELYINLGDISEDILKDGKKFYENGLNITGDYSQNDSTVWGYVPRGQSTVTAFDNSENARQYQDVGLNGMNSEVERRYGKYREFLEDLRAKIPDQAVLARFEDDPAGDNFHFYLGSDYDEQELDILSRYKYYNGTEGNSAEVDAAEDEYSLTRDPDTEDVNADNTLNEYEKYFEYRIDIKRDRMVLGQNYITEIADREVTLPNGNTETVRWYQFKVPISEYTGKEGNIRNFKSIRFIRMYMTGFDREMTLRFATLDLVRGEWRTYTQNNDLRLDNEPADLTGTMDVLSVNIEENGSKEPVNYVLPPGVSRQTTPGQVQIIPQNEQAMVMRVNDLAPQDARAVYKKVSYDMRQYKRLQLFVHAESFEDNATNLQDQELSCFIRLGTDMTSNYYEYEIPLVLTPEGRYNNDLYTDRLAVWPESNMFDFPFEVLTDTKLRRNREKHNPGSNVTNLTPYTIPDPDNQRNTVTVKGNPTLSEVKNIMIGIRNKSNSRKSGEVWVNELRMSEFDEDGGWAVQGNMALALSDIATVNVSGRTETAGFGSIESTVMDRRMDDLYQINVSTSADLGRFLPEKAKIQLPIYFSYSNETTSPKYNPLDEDILLDDALDALETQAERDSLRDMSNTVVTSKSFNVSNAKVNIKSKKPQFYDPANLSFTYAYTESNERSAEIERDLVKEQRAAIDYNFTFNTQPFEPFKNVKALSKPAWRIIKDFNLYYTPASLSFNTDMNRQFSQTILRDFNASSTTNAPDLNPFSKDFMWNRKFNISWNLTRSLSLTLNTATNAMIDEGSYVPELGQEYYEAWRDTVWQSIRHFGDAYTYQQTFNASWNLPINKIPIFSWITASASYNSSYSWNRVEDEEMGNIANTQRNWQGQGQFNFEQLYNKSKYLKAVDTRLKQKGTRPKFKPKTYTEIVNLEEGKAKTINHRLGSNRVQVSAADASGRPVQVSHKPKGNSAIELTPAAGGDSILVTIVSQDPNYRTPMQQLADYTVRALMMVRRASFTYRRSNALTLPGFKPEPGFFGQQSMGDNVLAPGLGFTFGFYNEETVLDDMKNKGWLIGDNDLVVTPAVFSNTSDLDVKVSLEPIIGLKIELNARQNEQSTTSVQYMTAGSPSTFTGSYNITQVAIGTAFKKIGDARDNYYSETYEQFKANRQIILNRLNRQYTGTRYPTTGFLGEAGTVGGQDYDPANGAYSENSADVLIPAFIAAYTGRDVNKISTSPFIDLAHMLPNWRVTYDGLSRIPWIKERFRSVSLTHSYVCRYAIGSYTSFSTWTPMADGSDYGYVRNESNDGLPTPSTKYDIPSVTLTEQFSPLIGVNVTMKNSMTAKMEYRKQRNLSLNLASTQLTDGSSDEIVVGLGYTLKDFDVILGLKSGKQSRVKNDLKLSVDVSYKDNKMLLRKIDEDLTQATSGNKVLGVKVMADYVFSSKVNFQVFFDHQGTTPLISTSYPVSTTNFGVGVTLMLTR